MAAGLRFPVPPLPASHNFQTESSPIQPSLVAPATRSFPSSGGLRFIKLEHVLSQRAYAANQEGADDSGGSLEEHISASLAIPTEAILDWKEKEEKQMAEMMEKDGISIRRRPPSGTAAHHVGSLEFGIEIEESTPRNILEEIIWNKDKEVSEMKEKFPLKFLLQEMKTAPPPRDFIGALRERVEETGLPGLIAEVKKASPSRGVLQPDFDPVHIAKAYEQGGAACLSVLTDSKYFQGSFDYLKSVRESGIKCPLLCKEFIVDAWQLYFARLHGADAVLLIAAVLSDQDLDYMSKIAKSLGMAVLIEVHNTREMDRILSLHEVDLVGINNRDLETFEVDINNTVNLLEGERGQLVRERNILVVSESGLFTPSDISFVQNAGVQAVLVGESLVKRGDQAAGISELFGQNISAVLS